MTVFTDKVIKFGPRMMRDLNISRIQCSGIFGNLGTETGGFTQLQELNPTVKGARGGYGWMQWTGPRRRKYEAWCKANNLDKAADESNYRYLIHETTTEEINSLLGLRKTTTLKAATETFMMLNLRPGIPHLDNRLKWAQKAQDALSIPGLGTAGAIVIAGSAAATQAPMHMWPWILLGTAVAAAVGYGLMVWFKKIKAKKEIQNVAKS